MKWSFKYSAKDEAYLMAIGAKELLEKPVPQNVTAWTAFQSLRGSRQIGFGAISPIPFSEIMAYCRHIGIDDPSDRQSIARFVIALDNLERQNYGNNQP